MRKKVWRGVLPPLSSPEEKNSVELPSKLPVSLTGKYSGMFLTAS